MNVAELCKKLEISEYPAEFEEIHASLKDGDIIPYGEDYLEMLEREYSLFGEHYDSVLRAYRALVANKELSLWCALAARLMRADYKKEVKTALKFPATEGAAEDMMRLFVLVSLVPECAEKYIAHGFSREETLDILKVFKRCLELSAVALGRPGYKDSYFNWTLIYLFCEMFDLGSFNFQFVRIKDKIKLFKNKTTGEHVLAFTEGRFHRDGKMLGDAGFTDDEGAFDADYSENENEYILHPVIDARVSKRLRVLKKSEWEIVIEEGDEALGLHIPRGVDFSREAIDESFKAGVRMARERFPEYSPKLLTCASWLLDPALDGLLGESSRIAAFGRRFLRLPLKPSKGRAGHSFIFLGYDLPDSELPDDTSLRRKVKKHYLDGGFIYSYRGFILRE